MTDELIFNGIDATTGGPLLPPMDPETLSGIIRGEPVDPEHLADLKNKYEATTQAHFAVKEGIDPTRLDQTGWGVLFPYNADPTLLEALKPLMDWRKSQAGKYYKEYTGPEGFRFKADGTSESKNDWLTRHGAGPGPADPEKVPYYLLIVGDPDTIPYRFQYQVDVQYGVGRIHFDKPEDYWNYANSVVQAEKTKLALAKRASFFAVANPDDPATNMSHDQLVMPLADSLSNSATGWKIETVAKEKATKTALSNVIGGKNTPALVFSASHGMGFPNGHELQFSDQGGLLCQDWPGPNQWRKPIPKDYYFTGGDVPDDANVFGLIAFAFACYGAGTPKLDEFAKQAFKTRGEIAPKSFLAGLPKRLLSHPKGGALAVIGHVERAWGYSFSWGKAGRQLAVFESALTRLFEGHPIGSALEYFNQRYAELSSDLSSELEEIEFGKKPDAMELAGMWTANNDARNFIVIGDPAVRLMVK
jgi:hypothetical protein